MGHARGYHNTAPAVIWPSEAVSLRSSWQCQLSIERSLTERWKGVQEKAPTTAYERPKLPSNLGLDGSLCGATTWSEWARVPCSSSALQMETGHELFQMNRAHYLGSHICNGASAQQSLGLVPRW